MKNLIEEIEKKKTNIDGFTASDYGEGYLECVDEILELLNQYNLITAPKSIKLSEIVKRLNEFYVDEYITHRENNTIYIHRKDESYLIDSIIEIFNSKITEIQLDYLYDETKWLYTLWIAGTEIVDDLKELKE